MKRYFNKPVDIRIYFTCGVRAVFEDIIGIEVFNDIFILLQDLGEFEEFYDADTLEELTLDFMDFRMEEIFKIEIV